jgi:hypothetical protein
MVVIKSQRAQKLLQGPKAYEAEASSLMRKYPNEELKVWVHLEREGLTVKKLSYSGVLEPSDQVILEATAQLIKNKPIAVFESLNLRECEAFLRDKNSETSMDGLGAKEEEKFKKFFTWLRFLPTETSSEVYSFSSQKGPFAGLKLVDKVRELKAFLNSPEVNELYQGSLLPELVDVEDLTVYIQAPYRSEEERAQFEELHILGVATFQEENLNFIPES